MDLKGFNDAHYRELGGRLATVLDTIRALHAMGFWVEIVTLVVPGFNDDPAELGEAAAFIASVSPDIPWHVTAFHPDYKMDDPARHGGDLMRAAAIGRDAGLRFVYAGNLPGQVGDLEDTRCPSCGEVVIGRRGYPGAQLSRDRDGRLPRLRHHHSGTVGPGVHRADHFAPVSCRGRRG